MMENHLVLVSIFLDDENKMKKASKVKDVGEIQDQAKKMYPVGAAYLERFMVYCKDFEEFIDVDNSHKVEAKEKYQLHFKSLKKTPTSLVHTNASCSHGSPAVESMTKQEFRQASQIFKKSLTKYRRGINKCAHKIALENPELLKNRGRLLKLSEAALAQSGYKYAGKGRARKVAKIELIPRDGTLSEHSYSAKSVQAGPLEGQYVSDQSGSQTTTEKNPSERTVDQTVDSSQVVANLEALVDTRVKDDSSTLSSSIQGGVTNECDPQKGPNVESAEMAELRKTSMIFGRGKNIGFTSYHIQMNEMAFRVALEKPHLLDKRGMLFREAQKRLYYSGYKYTRSNQTRSKLFQPAGIKTEKPLTKKELANCIANIDVKMTILKEQVVLITGERTKVEWHDRVEHLDKQIQELQDKIVALESEKCDLIKKGNTMKRKWAWELEFTEKRKRPASRRRMDARNGAVQT